MIVSMYHLNCIYTVLFYMYRQFMEYLADGNIDLVGVCVSKISMLTSLGNVVGELLTSFCCVKKKIVCFIEPKLKYNLYCHTLSMLKIAVHP